MKYFTLEFELNHKSYSFIRNMNRKILLFYIRIDIFSLFDIYVIMSRVGYLAAEHMSAAKLVQLK